jgi:hypothetical protein
MTELARAGFVPQVRVLARAFATRFFENEVTSSSRDLKSSFFWLIALLAQPGFFLPVLMVFDWSIAAFQGFDVLRVSSWDEKTAYLGYSMSAAGILAAVVWGALLLDRRDALVLGVMPTTGTRMVAAKLVALAGYCAVVFAGMHVVGAFFFGGMLAGREGTFVAFRGMAAHLVATTMASATVLIGAAGLQGLVTVIIGPVRFARISAWFQMAVTLAALINLLTLAPVIQALSGMLRSYTVAPPAWVMSTPVAWFLGLYEVLLGAPEPFMSDLARSALIAFSSVCLVTLVCQPLAYRSLVRSLVEQVGAGHRERASTRVVRWLAARLSTQPDERGVMEFTLLSFLRVDSHRLTLAMGVGAAAAWAVPMVASRVAAESTGVYASAFGAPLAMMAFLLTGLRTALGMPGDVRASWLFDLLPVGLDRVRACLRRLLMTVVVTPATAFGMVLVSVDAGWVEAVWSGCVSLLTGWLLVEASIWQWAIMPAARGWSVGRTNLQATWPWYVLAFVVLIVVIPRTAVWGISSPTAGAGLVFALSAAAIGLFRTGTSPAHPVRDDEESAAAPRLDLS